MWSIGRVAVAAVSVVIAAAACEHPSPPITTTAPSPAPPSGVVRLEPTTGRISGRVEFARPNVVAVGFGAVWVTNDQANTAEVERVDPPTGAVTPIALGPANAMNPNDLGVGAGAVWALLGDVVYRIDPVRARITDTFRDLSPGRLLGAIAASHGAIWVTDTSGGSLLRVDPDRGRVLGRTRVGASADWVAIGAGWVWVTDIADHELVQVAPHTGAIERRIPLPGEPGAVAAGEGAAWVTLPDLGEIAWVDPTTGEVRRRHAGSRPTGVAVGPGAVLVADTSGGTVSRIDPETLSVTWSVDVGGDPYAVAAGEGSIWVTLLRRFTPSG